MNATESMAAASHGPERRSENRNSIEANRLVSRWLWPSKAKLAARRPGSTISTSIADTRFRTAGPNLSSQNDSVRDRGTQRHRCRLV